MAIWPFNKKRLDQSMLPDEVSEYYKGEKGDTGRRSWVSALLTVAITALLAVVLFFGGKWIYQSIFGNNDESNETQTTQQDQTENSKQDNQDKTPESTTGNNDSTAGADDDAVDKTPSSGADSESTPTTGANEIPDTGPGPGGLQ